MYVCMHVCGISTCAYMGGYVRITICYHFSSTSRQFKSFKLSGLTWEGGREGGREGERGER